MIRKRELFKLTALIVLAAVTSGVAQTVTGISDLEFGDIFPGVPNTVSKRASSAAEFTVTGTAGAEVTLDFLLPTYVYTTGANMPVLFSATDCAIDSSLVPDQSSPSADNLNPYETITYRLGAGGLSVWLGGRVIPGLVQKSGNYTATIRLTVTYTGN
ncbi:MAG: hypothetical protein DRP45_07400 [Candidatus Zixiibacteriota bacterium]|nr:MAG: hypothetical protein DRP45_07400 [candidate division Zixibacteria bacterium]